MGVVSSRQRFMEKLDGGLQRNGFKQVESPYLTQKNEVVYNRGTEGKSNFFVFVKQSSLGVFVKYFDPDANKRLDDCMKRHVFTGLSSKSDERADKIIDEVAVASSNKPDNAYSLILHGHWKSVEGRRFYADDGASSDKLIVRDMMYHHADFDFTGHHNIVDLGVHEKIRQVEEPANISRAVSTEVTLRMFPDNGNGPHLMVWSHQPHTMLRLEKEFLQRNDYRLIFPSLATYMDPGLFLQWLHRELELKSVAVGIAHPFASVPLPFHPVAYGLFSSIGKRFSATYARCGDSGPEIKSVSKDFSLHLALALAKAYGNGIAAYNGAVSDGTDKIGDPATSEFMESLKRSYGMKGDTKNIHGFLVSNYLRDKYGLFPYYEPDFHSSPWSGSLYFYLTRRVYSRMSHGFTYYTAEKRPEIGEIVESMHDRKDTFSTHVRWMQSPDGTLSLDNSVNGFAYTMQSLYWTVATNANYLREFLWEAYRRVADIMK